MGGEARDQYWCVETFLDGSVLLVEMVQDGQDSVQDGVTSEDGVHILQVHQQGVVIVLPVDEAHVVTYDHPLLHKDSAHHAIQDLVVSEEAVSPPYLLLQEVFGVHCY